MEIFNSPVANKHKYEKNVSGIRNVLVLSQSECSFFRVAGYTNWNIRMIEILVETNRSIYLLITISFIREF